MRLILKYTSYFCIVIPIISCMPNLSRDLTNIAYLSYILRLPKSVSSSSPITQTTMPGSITVMPTAGLMTTESGLTASFTLVLDSLPTANVTIPISSSNTAEGTVSTSILTFTPANYNIPQTVFINGVNDAIVDGNINYTIVTGNATSEDVSYNGLNPSDVTVINADNDSVGISLSAISGNTNESGLTQSFTVVLNSLPTANVTIPISSSNTAEGTVSTSILTFTPANYNIPQTVFVNGVNDAIVDGNINYTIVTDNATSADPNYNGLNPSDVTVINVDNDSIGITISAISGNTNESGLTQSFTVVLNSAPTANVIIPISSSNTAEGTVSSTSLTFTTANYNIPQTVTVTGVNDSIADGNINYNIVTGNTTSGDASYHGLNPADLTLTNIDVGEKRTFISSSTLTGNIGGIAGADALCNSDGAKPSILPNVYKAMIVDGTNRKASNTANAGDGQVDWVFLPNTSYFRTDGTTLIKTTNANSIFVFPLTSSFDTPGIPYWTGLNTDWTTSSNRCATDWTSTTGNGQAGQATMLTSASISGGGPPPCNAALPRLLCVQQ
jgi:hypothetical protein